MFNIESIKNNSFSSISDTDINGRMIGVSTLNNIVITGRNSFYPNPLLFNIDSNKLIAPYDEKIMSLNKDSFYDGNVFKFDSSTIKIDNVIKSPVFFFIYNFDNYYHFLYDTIPYLHTYLEIKKTIPDIKLLINYPNPTRSSFYEFNIDILNKIVDFNNDIIIHKEGNLYERVFISSSLTHGGLSNLPPRSEIYDVYRIMKNNIVRTPNISHKKIYISRRTWINGDTSNIGTNYTTRRKMVNEDKLVEELNKLGVVEVFTENLSIDEKIQLFDQADLIIGSIGGGMSNLLFSEKKTKSIVIVTPFFLDINNRFKYSMENSDITYFDNVYVYKEKNDIPLFCRAKIKDDGKIGEIIDYDESISKYLLNISNNDVVGFNNSIEFDKIWFSIDEFQLLDYGLNSPYCVDIDELLKTI
jgi:hypothetical protein